MSTLPIATRIFSLCVLLIFVNVSQANEKSLIFGVVPQQSAKVLAALWTPILQHVSETSGVPVTFATAKDIPTFEKRLQEGRYDIAYMNPYHYIVFNELSGYQAIAKQIDKTIMGVIVAKQGSKYKRIEDLQGANIAFPAPAAFAATILPQAELNRLGIKFTPTYVSSHDSVYLNVSKAFFPAGGGIKRTLNNMPETTRSKLTTIWQSAAYTPHAIAALASIDPVKRDKIQNALMSMSQSKDGLSLLKSINFKGFEQANNQDWDDVRALQINTIERANKRNN